MLASLAIKGVGKMAVFMGAFPVLRGEEDAAREFARESLARSEEFAASQSRQGITREEWALQQTSEGDSFVLVRFEAPDLEAAFAELGQSNDPFDVWARERIKEISGVDMASPSDDPLPEIILDWTGYTVPR